MSQQPPDVINHLAGLPPDSPVAALREHRAIAREQAQRSHIALFERDPAVVGSRFERWQRQAVASFVALLHQDARAADFYNPGAEWQPVLAAEAQRALTLAPTVRQGGPWGRFPAGPLSVEDQPGERFRIGEAHRALLGAPLAAALEHSHLLVLHPRDARPADLQALLDAGWHTPDIVTLSQLVSFLAFQLRVAHGLRVLSQQGLATSATAPGVSA